ncbi:hypothetical protein EUGRSUZ_A01562 [Eucalyptus grandis]|uniref:Uncharacterized protein n=2 Tax=Eucalyptus grandis TaxID=71139 RepID=A0ACC3M315_EUCGR|nr:hypothetical protein EUGRSUZ_A01562 [Eucalyptus grandis]
MLEPILECEWHPGLKSCPESPIRARQNSTHTHEHTPSLLQTSPLANSGKVTDNYCPIFDCLGSLPLIVSPPKHSNT